MDIYITTPRDANAFITVDAQDMAWVIYMKGDAVPEESLDLLHALQALEDWTSGEIERIDDESLALWNALHDIEDWAISEIENTKFWVSGEFKDVEEDFSDLLELLNNEIDKLNKTDVEQRAVLQNHTQVIKVLYNRTMALREVLLALKNEFIYFVNETIIAVHGIKDDVILLTANVTNLQENVSALKEKIRNLEDDISSLEAEMDRIGYILGGVGGVGLIAVGLFYVNRRYHIGEFIRNGNGYFENGRHNRFTEFIEKNKIIKENSKKARKVSSKITLKKRRHIRRNPEKSPLLMLSKRERKTKKSHLRMRVKRKPEVKLKHKEQAKQKRKEKILAKKKAREKRKATRKAERKARLEAKRKEKAYNNLTRAIDAKLAKQKRPEKILAKKKAREKRKATRKAERKARLEAKRKKQEIAKVSRLKGKTARPRRMHIRRNPEKSPLRILSSFFFYNK